MITTPINEALGKVNGYLDLNGQLNDLVAGGLGQIDPELGAAYNPPPPANQGSYNLGGLFNDNQVDFDTGSGSSTITGNGNNAQNNTAALQAARQKLEAEQSKLAPAQNAVNQAQNRLNQCQNMSGMGVGGQNCGSAQNDLAQAQANLNLVNNNINQYRQDVVNIAGNSTANVGNTSGGMNFSNAPQTNTPNTKSGNQVAQNSTAPVTQPNNYNSTQEPKKSGGFTDALKNLWD